MRSGRSIFSAVAVAAVMTMSFTAPAFAKGGNGNGGANNGGGGGSGKPIPGGGGNGGGSGCPNKQNKYPPGQCYKVSLSSSSVARGDSVQVDGDGFSPNSPVNVFLGTGEGIATIVTDASGAFSTKVQVPATAETGQKQIMLKGLDDTGAPVAVSNDVNILAKRAASSSSSGGDSSIALLAVAGGFVALGGAAVVAARKRREAVDS